MGKNRIIITLARVRNKFWSSIASTSQNEKGILAYDQKKNKIVLLHVRKSCRDQ